MKQVLARVDLELWILLLQACKQACRGCSKVWYSSCSADACAADDGNPLRGSELLCEGMQLLLVICLDDSHLEGLYTVARRTALRQERAEVVLQLGSGVHLDIGRCSSFDASGSVDGSRAEYDYVKR